ncbi:transcriptional regulator [Pleurocapsa sp. CCALA 161]|uniref:winged helix-turn-helix transcriptional regulator n=1 Tax=Pleurocapsa sp. CCALA 161 TaxID=2107688 RepID=UPI000D077DED|nr:helix-turn-helix domain-containing protein [Pleurocapsa sp. CCALA 161]PSB12255.1 transcriptional regulator [Pleurocapsa sp. CCALA 161]
MVSKTEPELILDKDCPVRQVINIVGDKWTLPVLYVLNQGTKRYSEIQREIPGISKKMLTQTLRRLESDNIIKRKIYPVVPPKTEYALTTFGKQLIEPLEILANWAWEHQAELKLICDRRALTESNRRQKSTAKKLKNPHKKTN